ncbi:hypothetical protein BCR33DRAFT_721959 [Rhizoclosmatium globosum]|uniref:Peptidase C51 domain-containing protein n=1 Tax=Rhizoclosmatium globosum TaxID=329046 RepID=A0A1Y2BPU3_9FUNG|nr:hypothetical protein BCR33DRAFT_721959 [Rhizoclosmatium globosum]|eukprot:ORY36750.1 hypothetical protein BCR33DRAFT_721959 [Rhizoclosmatium globosum]
MTPKPAQTKSQQPFHSHTPRSPYLTNIIRLIKRYAPPILLTISLVATFLQTSKFHKITSKHLEPAPFGTLLGTTLNGVQVFSCNSTATSPIEPNYVNGIYTGEKWQCVELARRYLIITQNITFDSIEMAYDIFDLPNFQGIDGSSVLISKHKNTLSTTRPVVGSLLIWASQGFYVPTGHVAVITHVTDDFVEIAEQNVQDTVWLPNQHFSRRLSLICSPTCTITDTYEGEILGWMTVKQ